MKDMEKRFKAAFDALSFSPNFQTRTKALLRERTAGKENAMNIKRSGKMMLATAACLAALAVPVSAAMQRPEPGARSTSCLIQTRWSGSRARRSVTRSTPVRA